MTTFINAHTLEEYHGKNLDTLKAAYNGTDSVVMVAGFDQWKKEGRVVRKGEKAAAKVWIPRRKRDDDDDKPRRFVRNSVFFEDQTVELNQ